MNKKVNFSNIILMGLVLFFVSSCKKDDDYGLIYIEPTFTDSRDGKVYQTVVIGSQIWMAENLAFEPSNGNYWAYNNDLSYIETFGYLYDWETAQNVCPNGWYLPGEDDWEKLNDYLTTVIGFNDAGGKLKTTGTIEAGTGLWREPNTQATNSSGFSALPGGGYNPSNDVFGGIHERGLWWASTPPPQDVNGNLGWNRWVGFDKIRIVKNGISKEHGLSVRCLKNPIY